MTKLKEAKTMLSQNLATSFSNNFEWLEKMKNCVILPLRAFIKFSIFSTFCKIFKNTKTVNISNSTNWRKIDNSRRCSSEIWSFWNWGDLRAGAGGWAAKRWSDIDAHFSIVKVLNFLQERFVIDDVNKIFLCSSPASPSILLPLKRSLQRKIQNVLTQI